MKDPDSRPIEIVRALAVSVVPVPPADQAEAQRAAVLTRLRELQVHAVQARTRRARPWRRVVLWAAAAAIPLVVAGASWFGRYRTVATGAPAETPVAARVDTVGSGAQLIHAAAPVAVHGHAEVRSGDTLVTGPDEPASIALPSGARIVAAPSSTLTVHWSDDDRHHEVVSLSIGTVDVVVPKLGTAAFTVVTPDAQVVVHGTRFTVRVARQDPGTWKTDVSVTEGRVLVSHAGLDDAVLDPGGTWTSCSESPAVAQTSGSPAASASPASGVVASGADKRRVPVDTLAVENSLYEAAIAASRAGDDARAVALFDRLLAGYPDSPLANVARRERDKAARRLAQRKNDSGAGE